MKCLRDINKTSYTASMACNIFVSSEFVLSVRIHLCSTKLVEEASLLFDRCLTHPSDDVLRFKNGKIELCFYQRIPLHLFRQLVKASFNRSKLTVAVTWWSSRLLTANYRISKDISTKGC
jgi:hypothetical protein